MTVSASGCSLTPELCQRTAPWKIPRGRCSASNLNGLGCQSAVMAHTGAKGLSGRSVKSSAPWRAVHRQAAFSSNFYSRRPVATNVDRRSPGGDQWVIGITTPECYQGSVNPGSELNQRFAGV